MTLDARLIHRCTIVRVTPATDATPAADVPHLADVPCFYLETATDERVESGGTRLVKRSLVMLPAGTDVSAQDRFTTIVNAYGDALIPRAYSVDGDPIVRDGSHVTAILSGVS